PAHWRSSATAPALGASAFEAAAPDLQITHVCAVTSSDDNAVSDIQISWTALVPKQTLIESFDVLLEVRYSDGSRNVVRSDQLKSSARSMIFQMPSHPRQLTRVSLKDYRAVLRANFRVASTLSVTREVAASQEESSREVAGSSSSTQPEVFITRARLISCSQDRHCVELKWTAGAPRNVAIHHFIAMIDAVLKDGTHTVDSRKVGGSTREARLHLAHPDSRVASISVSLLTNFSAFDSKTAIREGPFSDQ